MASPSENPKPQVDKSQIELVADDDWKNKVKAEDAKLDAQRAAQSAPSTEAAARGSRAESKVDSSEMPLPPPGIDSITQLFVTQAMVAMGIVPGPDGEFVKQFPLARHFIDLLGVLEEKTKGNLSPQEARLLSVSLHELRIAFVEQSKKG